MVTINDLTPAEKKIYEAIIRVFPATDHLSAIDYAVQGGARFQFIPK
jgi:hypothetical protein